MRRFAIDLTIFLTLSGAAMAADKPLMHCFAFTPVETATPADWNAFYKLTDALPKKIKGVTHVWYGKLQNPMNVYSPDEAASQKFKSGAEKAAGEFSRSQRKFGVCMEMKNEGVLKTYAADPYHKIWDDGYSKVRIEGTTTFNMIGQ